MHVNGKSKNYFSSTLRDSAYIDSFSDESDKILLEQSKEYTADAKTLLNGWPFYVDTENKHFRLNILVRDEGIKVYEITKNERPPPHLYEKSELKAGTRTFTLEESTYRRHTREDGSEYFSYDFISNVIFGVSEITDSREGGIKVVADNKRGGIRFYRDRESGGIVQDFESSGVEEISQEETMQLIEQARVLKDTMRTLVLYSQKITQMLELIVLEQQNK